MRKPSNGMFFVKGEQAGQAVSTALEVKAPVVPAPVLAPAPVKRKRGRPRKNPVQQVDEFNQPLR